MDQATKNKSIDEEAKRFLGVTDAKDIKVLEGQSIDQKKLKEVQEREMLNDACYFGDIMVKYVVKHPDISPEQRAWGFMLGLVCVRQDYPEGVTSFDEMADLGGEDLVLEKVSVDNLDALPADHDIAKAISEDALTAAAQFSELFSAYIGRTKRTLGTSNPQTAYGLGRAMHNLRLSFPEEKGGPAGFDHWAASAGEYFRKR